MSPMFHPTLDNNSGRLDLYELVAHHPYATFFMRYEGSDLEELRIFNGDVLVIDRSVDPKPSKPAVVIRNEEFKVERIQTKTSKKSDEKNLEEIEIWGVITFVIHKT